VVAPVQQCYFWQETPKFPRQYELEHCYDEAAMTSFPTVLFFSPLLSVSESQDVFIDVVVVCSIFILLSRESDGGAIF